MTGQQAFRANGDEGKQQPRNEQEQISSVLASSDINEILSEVNAGLGNYDDGLLFQQEEDYRKALIAITSFQSLIVKRQIEDTKRKLGREGLRYVYDEKKQEAKNWQRFEDSNYVLNDRESTWTAERRRGEEIWEYLGDPEEPITEKQHAAIVKVTGLEPGQWTPMFADMFAGRHEMSRSRGAELIRLFLGKMFSFKGDGEDAEKAKQGILRRP